MTAPQYMSLGQLLSILYSLDVVSEDCFSHTMTDCRYCLSEEAVTELVSNFLNSIDSGYDYESV